MEASQFSHVDDTILSDKLSDSLGHTAKPSHWSSRLNRLVLLVVFILGSVIGYWLVTDNDLNSGVQLIELNEENTASVSDVFSHELRLSANSDISSSSLEGPPPLSKLPEGSAQKIILLNQSISSDQTHLSYLPDPGLLERSEYGLIPKRDKDGRLPMHVYARKPDTQGLFGCFPHCSDCGGYWNQPD